LFMGRGMTDTNRDNTYLWCDNCRRSYRHDDATDGTCPVCGEVMQPTRKMTAILRGLMANELSPSPIVTKHRQMIRLIWSRNGQGEAYYRLLEPNMPYNRFEARVTELICQGAEEGWITIVFPSAPNADERAYRVDIKDEDRFLAELATIASAPARRH
jgi:hypothetical protein